MNEFIINNIGLRYKSIDEFTPHILGLPMSLISKNTARYKPFLTPLLTKSFLRLAVIMLLSVATLLLTGCGEEPNPPAKQVAEEQPSRFSKDKRAYRHTYHPEWPKEVRDEVYGDKKNIFNPAYFI